MEHKKIYVTSGQRLGALDSLRGISSVAVMWFHFYVFSNIGLILRPYLPRVIDLGFSYGSLGVVVFFVLSGFVITLSLVDKPPTLALLRKFTIRRSIRLDIPYLAVLIFATALLVIAHKPPTVSQFIFHLFYLQNIFGFKNIVSQFWTLCYEFQFYLFFSIIFILYKKNYLKYFSNSLFIVPFVISLIFAISNHSSHGWFIDRWYEFFLGGFTLWFLIGNLNFTTWILIIAGTLTLGVVFKNMDLTVSSCVACLLGTSGMAGGLTRWSGGPILAWLGQISYSLYLIHFIGGVIAKKLVSGQTAPFIATAVFIVSTLVSVAAASVIYFLIEKPSHRLSRSFGNLPKNVPSGCIEKNVSHMDQTPIILKPLNGE